MIGDSLTKLRLSVWRDFVPSRALIFRTESSEGERERTLANESDLQQEVYSWQMMEDPFGGITDEDNRRGLRESLIDCFEASKPPSQRRVVALTHFLTEAERVINANKAEWTFSQNSQADDEDVPYRINPLLALKLHLEWLKNTFEDQPGVSVSIR